MTSTAERQLALLVPGLFGPTGEQGGTDRPFAALESLLARADRSTHLTAGFEAQLFGLFGVSRPAEGDWPVAAVTRIVDAGVADKDWWTRADPVHLQASTNGLILTDAAEPKLTPQYSHALVSVPMVIVPADGWLFKAPHAPRRYRPRPRRRIFKPPPCRIIGRDVIICRTGRMPRPGTRY